MNDFDHENEIPERETETEVVASGLLPHEQFRPGARLEVADDPKQACETERLYREIPIRIDGTRTALLVGPWCELQSERSYRVRKLGEETARKALVAVEIVECDPERSLYRA